MKYESSSDEQLLVRISQFYLLHPSYRSDFCLLSSHERAEHAAITLATGDAKRSL